MLAKVLTNIRQKCENILIQNHSIILSPEEKFHLALSIVFQMLRGTNMRKYAKQRYDELLPLVVDKARIHFSPMNHAKETLIQSFTENDKYFKDILMKIIFSQERVSMYLKFIMMRSFIFFRIQSEQSFVTSDNPVVLIDIFTGEAAPFSNGIALPSTAIYYPISSKLLLGAYHPDTFINAFRNMDSSIVIIKGIKERRFIDLHNKKQKEHCSGYIYAQSKEVLEYL